VSGGTVWEVEYALLVIFSLPLGVGLGLAVAAAARRRGARPGEDSTATLTTEARVDWVATRLRHRLPRLTDEERWEAALEAEVAVVAGGAHELVGLELTRAIERRAFVYATRALRRAATV
jgi:hypothetical protein